MSRRLAVRALGVAVLLAAVGGVGYAVTDRPRAAQPGTDPVPAATASVTKGTVTERVQVPGTLAFTGSYPVIHQSQPGILTSAVAPGATVDRGGVLYTVGTQPVRLLFGDVPAFRDLAPGMPDGPDVLQLEQNLVALGMDPGHAITVDQHFSAATAAAVRRWQAAWGLPPGQRSGTLHLGDVVFLPAALRIAQERVAIGASVAPGVEVLSATSTNRTVTAQVSADRLASIHIGDQVLVSATGQQPVPGKVTAVGEVSAQPGTADNPAPGPMTAPITITLSGQLGGGAAQLPVQVAITIAAHPGVLLVPVTALLARPGGGYEVRLASGEFVAVQLGLFDEASGTAEVSGPGLAEGQRVQVPSS